MDGNKLIGIVIALMIGITAITDYLPDLFVKLDLLNENVSGNNLLKLIPITVAGGLIYYFAKGTKVK